MSKYTTFITQNPVVLEGYQAIMKPSKFGYTLEAIIDQALVDRLEANRTELLSWAKDKLKNPKRSTLKPEPWEEVSEGKYKIKMAWKDANAFPVVDSEGTVLTNPDLPLFAGSRVKLAFYQKPYILKDGTTYGTCLKPVGVQVVSLASAGIEVSATADEVAAMFGRTDGFKAADAPEPESDEEPIEVYDDFDGDDEPEF